MFKKIYLTIIIVVFIQSSYADIFGTDDRHDINFSSPKNELARSVAVGVLYTLWTDLDNGFSELWVDPVSDFLCEDEAFSTQNSIDYACTGFLIGPDLLITAGHCAVNNGEIFNEKDKYCESYTWMFDYRAETDPTKVSHNDIYRCQEIIYAISDESNGIVSDFALIRLDRKVKNRTPFTISKDPTKKYDSVSMLGHPMGLPLKLTDNAYIFDLGDDHSLYTNLDAFAGNSGSPVLNEKDEMIGLLVAGNPSHSTYEDPIANCSRYNKCDELGNNCKVIGENQPQGFPNTYSEVQKIKNYIDLIERNL